MVFQVLKSSSFLSRLTAMKTGSCLLLVAILLSFVQISSGQTKGKLLAQQKTRLNISNNEKSKLQKGKSSNIGATTPVPKQNLKKSIDIDRLEEEDDTKRNDDEYAKELVDFRVKMSWEKYLIPIPTSLGILSTLIAMSADPTNDFPLNDHFTPTGGFIYTKHANSFHLSLFQISQESYQAFLCAHTNMNRIRLSTLTIPDYMNDAIDILNTKDMELIRNRLHLPLTVVQKSIESYVKWSSEVVTAFKRLDNLTEEVLLAAKSLLQVKTDLGDILVKNKTINELKDKDLQTFLNNQKEQLKIHLYNQSQVDKAITDAHISVPTDIDEFSMNVMQFFTGMLFKSIETLSKEETGKPIEKLKKNNHSASHDSCIYINFTPIIDIKARSQILLDNFKTIQSIDSRKGQYNATRDMNDYKNLLTTNNESIECEPLKQVIKMGCDTIELIHKLAHATIESMPINEENEKEEDKNLKLNEWRNIEFVVVREKIKRFNEEAKNLENIVLERQKMASYNINLNHPSYNIGKSARYSEQLRANALNKITYYTELGGNLTVELDKNRKEIMEKTNQSIHILNKIRNWNTKEIGLNQTVEMLTQGLADLHELKGNWTLLTKFFEQFSQIIEPKTRNAVVDFINKLNTTIGTQSFKTRERFMSLVIKQIREKMVRANQVLTLVHDMTSTYHRISRDHLMPRVHRLDYIFVNVSTVHSNNMASEREQLIKDCENDVNTIKQLIEEEQEMLLKNVKAVVGQIIERNYRFLQNNRQKLN